MRKLRPTPVAAADAGAGVKPAPQPASVALAASAAPIASAEPVAIVAVRVISASHGHEVDDVLHLAANEAVEAERLAWGDASPAAIAEAERLRSIGEDSERD